MNQEKNQEIAAAKARMDRKTARKYLRARMLPGELLTSKLPFSRWEEIFRDAMTTAAAIDRLVHHCVILELNIPGCRMEQAKKHRDCGLAATEPEGQARG